MARLKLGEECAGAWHCHIHHLNHCQFTSIPLGYLATTLCSAAAADLGRCCDGLADLPRGSRGVPRYAAWPGQAIYVVGSAPQLGEWQVWQGAVFLGSTTKTEPHCHVLLHTDSHGQHHAAIFTPLPKVERLPRGGTPPSPEVVIDSQETIESQQFHWKDIWPYLAPAVCSMQHLQCAV